MTKRARWAQWSDRTYVLGGSVVGTISRGAGSDWFAYGCLNEWNDVWLGNFDRQVLAMKAVEKWVKNHE